MVCRLMKLQVQRSQQEMDLPLILAAFMCLIANSVSLPNGAPDKACSNLLPRHRGAKSPQGGSSPYKVTAVKTEDHKVEVTISSTNGEEFQGFILQARSAEDSKRFVAGQFEGVHQSSKAIDCNGQEKSTLTHSDDSPKTLVTAEWTSPVDGDVIFKATVAKDYAHFWENVDSNPITLKTGGLTSSEISTEHSVYDGCSETYQCFGLPSRCNISRDCHVLLTHENTPDGTILFSLHGLLEPSEYMAMALSDDAVMGDDFVTECIRTGANDGKLQHSWNEGRSNTGTTEASVKYEFTFEDGMTTCTWIAENITSFHGRTFDLLNKNYHVLLAQGPVENGRITYHSIRHATSDPIQFFPHSNPTDSTQTDDDSTDDQPGGKKSAIPTALNGTDVESSSSRQKIGQLLFGLCGSLFLLL